MIMFCHRSKENNFRKERAKPKNCKNLSTSLPKTVKQGKIRNTGSGKLETTGDHSKSSFGGTERMEA